ncbi:MAG: response regulator transcription factor [Saprospiraceae bacterium]
MAKVYQILFVEDEPSLAMIVKDSLVQQGYAVQHFSEAESALKAYHQQAPDLLILDVMLPKSNGYDLAKQIRNTDRLTPIIFLTAKSKVQDVVTGFESGGNDYLRKPFSIEELLIRIKVLLNDQRLLPPQENTKQTEWQIGQYYFDSMRQTLDWGAQSIVLTGREAMLLALFCQHQNSLLEKSSILLKIWGDDSFFNSRSMDVYISKLRKHLKKDPSIKIINIRGAGYKLVIG